MTPILYEKDEIDFTSQGLGSLVEIYDVDVEEQRNGLLQLTASYPVSGVRYADISVGRIILAKPNQRDSVHAFRIVTTELDISGYAVTIEADSITYDLTHNLVKHLVASGNGQSFMTALKNEVVNPSIFAFYSDIATSSTTSLNYVNPMEAIMGTTGSFLQIWGGELKRENRRVAMFNRRGRDNVATFRLGKNISGLKYSVDISSLVTRIIPTKSVQNDDQTTTTLEGTPVDSQYINNYEQIYTLPLEFTDDTIKTVADLNAAAKGWFTKSANTGRDKPTVTIDIDVLSLQDSADYQDKFKNLESVSLTDTVTVYVPEYGVNVTAIVNELHYDPILDRVTKMTVGTAKQSFADSSRTQLSDLQDKIISVQNQADAVAVSANGKSTNYYGSVKPSHPQEGDTWFWVNGDKSGIKQFVNGDWADLVDSDTQEKIAASVTEAVTQAKEHVEEVKQGLSSDIATAKSQATSLANAAVTQANAHTATAIEQNNASQQEVMNDIAKSQADSAIKDGDFNNKAQAMADKALADAKSNTTQVAQDTLNTANQNLADAKKSLTDGISKEASDRASAVNELDTKAQGYVNVAKTDVLETVNKEVTDRQNAVTALDTKAQGYANVAKTDALNALTEEVTNRQNAVSALDTKATNAVNQAKSDINDTINALSVGGRNYLLNSNGSTLDKWTPVNGWSIISDADRGNTFTFTPTTSWTGGSTNSLSQTRTDFPANKTVTVSFWAKASVDGAKFHSEPTGGTAAANSVLNVSLKTNWQRYSYTFYLSSARIYFMPVDSGVTYWVDDLQLEIGNMISDYNQAPEDVVYDYTDKDNQIKQTFTQYKQSNDGKVTKAQTDATTALGQVATKVSQTDYDTKTGDLTTKYTQVKQTTDSQATDIADIKKTATSQASKINSISSDVDGTKQSISDIETTQDSQSDKINQITSDVNGTKQSITDIQTKDGQQDTRMGTIETSVSGVKSDFSTYKSDANGRISTAQTTAQTAVDGLKNKVSQTDYNTKTGQLQTDLTTTTQTANKAKTDIVSIKQTDTSQDSRMNTIESDASGTKQTVSNIQTKQGQQDASITTLQTRADGIEANVSKTQTAINDLQQINQIPNSEFVPDFAGWHAANDQQVADETSDFPAGWYRAGGRYNNSTVIGNQLWVGVNGIHTDLIPVSASQALSGSAVGYSNPDYDGSVTLAIDFAYYDSSKKLISSNRSQTAVVKNWTKIILQATTPTNTAYVSFAILTNGSNGVNYYSQPMLVFSNTLGSYVQGTYNNNGATAKAQLTADQATLSINNYKTNADGRISQAQADIKANATAITQKVSQTVYDQKTGDLSTKINDVKHTADSSAQTIADIKTADGKQDDRMAEIEHTAEGISSTVSDLSTEQGKQSGYISTLKQKAEGFEATVTKVDNLSVGARNYFLNSSGTSMDKWSQNGGWTNVGSAARGTVFTINSKTPWSGGATNSLYQSGINIDSGTQVTVSFWAKSNVNNAKFHSEQTGGSGSFDTKLTTTFTKYSYTFVLTSKTVYFMAVDSGVSYYVDDVKIETGDFATDWTPAPEDVDSATAKAQLTADNASLAISKLTNADGVITKAQADIRANADAITKTVSKTVYDQNNGDLNQAISKAQSTADGAVSTVGNYKTSNDGRVESAESKIEQNSKDITARVIQTDYDDFKGSYNSKMSEISSTFDRITSTVSETETTVNKLNQVNLVNNSQFTPDYSGWHVGTPWGNSLVSEIWNNGIEKNTGAMWVWHDWSKSSGRIYSDPISIYGGSPISASVFAAMPNQSASGIPIALYIITYDSSKNVVDRWNLNVNYNMIDGTFRKFSLDNKTPSSNALYATVAFDWSVGGQVSFGKPMLVFGSTTGDYVAGPYNNNDKIASQQITIDGITNIVSDPTTGLSTRVQTAEGTLNTVKSTADGAMSKASQTANDITQEIKDRGNGDSNTLQSAKEFTQSSITSSEKGMKSVISQTADGIIAKVDTMNMVTNSEFDPTNVGWYSMSNAIGSGLGSDWNAPTTGGFADWPIVGGSRLILYNVGTWYTSELRTSSAGKVYSASIIAGRSAVPAQSTALDFKIGFWDSGKKLLGTVSAGNIIDGASYKGMAKYSIESTTAPTGTAYVSVIIAHSGAASDIIGRPMLSSGATAVPYTPTTATTSSSTILSLLKDNWSIGINDNIGNITSGIVGNSSSMSLISKNIALDGNTTFTALKKTVGDTNDAVSRVKNTADSISNFVRDSSGNISANFQTALSKTSIISDSTLASSIQKQTSSQITSALTDNNGKIISLINQDSSGVQIGGENIILDGTVSVLSTFWAKQINAMKVNANNITVGTLNGDQVNITNVNAANITGDITNFIKSNWDSAYGNVSITPTNITLQSYSGTSLMTELDIGSLGMTMKMPGVNSFLDSTVINANGMSFQHNGGSYATVGVMDAGFTLEHNTLGGAPMSIRIGDGADNKAEEMAFAISAAQSWGTSPQLIWAGNRVGKVSSKYRTWDNPHGFILAEDIKFSTWDNTASIVEIDDTVNFYNYAPIQVNGMRFSDGTTRSLHLGGKDFSTGAKWFGFLDGGDQAGFGTDNTGDVWFFMGGKTYSLYTMLEKLGMR